jgi:hypothetical protein
VTKNELLDDLWGHRFVSESVLKTAISDLRTALDDHPREPRFIETVSRRGYRFIASTAAIAATKPMPNTTQVRGINYSRQPAFASGPRTQACPRGAQRDDCSDMRGPVCPFIKQVDTSRPETGSTLPEAVFATLEEVCYAHQLRLHLRGRLLRDNAAPAAQAWSVGAD